MQQRENIKCHLFSKLDAQWQELFNIYLARSKRVEMTKTADAADFVVVKFADLSRKTEDFFKDRRFIVLSFGDLPQAMLGLREEDQRFRDVMSKKNARLFYLHGEVEPKNAAKELGAETDPGMEKLFKE